MIDKSLPQIETDVSSDHPSVTLSGRLKSGRATIAVVGLGYVGLPLACRFASQGLTTVAFDVDKEKVKQLSDGNCYLSHMDAAWVRNCVSRFRFHPTTNVNQLADADVIVVCVPTPLTDTREPDLSYVEAAARMIATAMRPGQLIILESTTWPGTTREVLVPILETSGMRCGESFFVAYSPEREDPGNARFDTSNTPKVVAGIDEESTRLAQQVYGHVVRSVVPVESLETAEATKLLENIYRAVNIALVNELKTLFDPLGINIWSVIEAAKTKPFGFQAFYPGPGLGGHCIPIDPFYLTWLARKHNATTRFIELAGEINTRMPEYVANRVQQALNDQNKPLRNSRVCVLGVAYKRDVDDCRESPAFPLMKLLEKRGAMVSYNDPLVPHLDQAEHAPALSSQELTGDFLERQDAVVLITDHSAYDFDAILPHCKVFVDTRNAAAERAKTRSAKVYLA